MNEDNAKLLLKNGKYGVLSMQAENGGAYAVPVSYFWDGKDALYIHCAPEGRKLKCMSLCPRVSVCVIGNTKIYSSKFTTAYESIILECNAVMNLSDKEKMDALMILLDKFAPNDKIIGKKYAEKSFHRTEVVRLDVVKWSGKAKRIE